MTNPEKKGHILIVDDSVDTLELLRRNLVAKKYKVFTAPGVHEAVNILDSTPVDLVITDIKMPKVSGIELVRYVRENFADTEVLVITGFPSVKGAVEAVKIGAEEYIIKPFTDEELFTSVQKAFNKLHRRKVVQIKSYHTTKTPQGIIGESDAIQNVFKTIAKTTRTMATVLLSGESGTGKELVARAIHYKSPQASAQFVPVNCGGIPEDLLESELFGYKKGAFTGALETRAGFFQTANGGTIFLDEISNTSLSMQAKLLRVLQEKEVNMLGANKSQKIDVRVIAATNVDLIKLVESGAFREDLYYRINIINVNIPPLRERGDDIFLLIHHFVNKFTKEIGKPSLIFSDAVLKILKSYHWPGNVRELENIIQRLVIMAERDIIEVHDLPPIMRFTALREKGLDRTLAEVEVDYIINVLASESGNKTRAAEILGIDRKTLREKLKNTKKVSS